MSSGIGHFLGAIGFVGYEGFIMRFIIIGEK
jgi:hypothetical protein